MTKLEAAARAEQIWGVKNLPADRIEVRDNGGAVIFLIDGPHALDCNGHVDCPRDHKRCYEGEARLNEDPAPSLTEVSRVRSRREEPIGSRFTLTLQATEASLPPHESVGGDALVFLSTPNGIKMVYTRVVAVEE